MEAATLGRGRPTAYAQSIREAARARSRAFWIVAGLTALAALLRFATLGVQSYHHDEAITAGRVLGSDFLRAMDVVGFSESAPPLYYALAWLWTQATGTGEFGLRSLSALAGVATVPVAYLIALELRGRRAGLMAAALVAVSPLMLWYSQEARAYALVVLLCGISLLYCVRAYRHGRPRDLTGWGIASALALATHYFAVFPILAEVVLLVRRRGRASLGGLWIIGLAGLLLAPLALHQMSHGHAEWISLSGLGHRIWETASAFVVGETADLIARPERPELAIVPLFLCLCAFLLLLARGEREDRRAAIVPSSVALATVGIPLLLAVVPGGKDFVLARNLIPAVLPLLVVVAIAVTMPTARRLGAVVGASLLVYSFGFSVWASFSPDLHRPDWSAVATEMGEPDAPRATVTWTIGQAPLRDYLESGAIEVTPSEGYDWLIRELNFVSYGEVPPPSRAMLGPGFRETGREQVGQLFIRRYRLPGPGLVPLRLRRVDSVDLNFRTNGVLLDGVGFD
ncbi:MAG: glycosyltransferase family 39 protein [Solirubrobacterales bacterium]